LHRAAQKPVGAVRLSMTKRIHLLLVALAVGFASLAQAQIFDPVKWAVSIENRTATTADLILTATIEKGWHLYSQHLDGDGPVPTTFSFKQLGTATLKGEVSEGKGKVELDPNFDMQLKYFEGTARFIQKIALTPKATEVKGEVEFMVCDDKRCLPPSVEEFDVKVSEFSSQKSETNSTVSETSSPQPDITSSPKPEILDPIEWTFSAVAGKDNELELRFTAKLDKGWHLYSTDLPKEGIPIPTSFSFTGKGFETIGSIIAPKAIVERDSILDLDLAYFTDSVTFIQRVKVTESIRAIAGQVEFNVCNENGCLPPDVMEFSIEIPSADAMLSASTSHSWLGIFIAGFLGGLLALLTPCVFPMLPLTVSFFTKQSKTKAKGVRNAIIYSLSIIGIYVALGFLVTVVFGADALNALSTNVWFNLFFFFLLTTFAISFLGAFEITLPSSWVNKADQASDRGGLIGIFFMAFTLSLVSFSCTGPIIGTLLVEAAVNGGVMGPIMGMTGFSVALALPFGLFAAFPGWLNSMPKSGGWLNVVKVSLGLLELALAFKFLSNADLVVQAGLLQRELFLAIWIAIFGTLTLYLFGFIHFPHDSKTTISPFHAIFWDLMALIFTIYLVPGYGAHRFTSFLGFHHQWSTAKLLEDFKFRRHHLKQLMQPSWLAIMTIVHMAFPCFHDYQEGYPMPARVGKARIDRFHWLGLCQLPKDGRTSVE
jgi:thiol:disulfide interchange protein